jgi:cytochrome c-type biogenesis protein CcmH/NrfG
VLRSAKGDTDGAIRAFEQAVFRDSAYANARYFLGASFASKGDFARAIEQFEAISELSSENAEAVREILTSLRNGENPFPQGNSPVAETPSVPLAE